MIFIYLVCFKFVSNLIFSIIILSKQYDFKQKFELKLIHRYE
jgi:hypothetical protein